MKKGAFSKTRILLLALILIISGTSASFATQTVDYTTNGNAAQYVAGSVLVLYGKVTDNGTAVPRTTVTVDIQDSAAKVIYYGKLTTDSNGYFKTTFTIPPGVNSSMTVKISTIEEEKVNVTYSLSSSGSVVLTGSVPQGSLTENTSVTIPASTAELGLVFSANVNYFNNRSSNLDLDSLGVNEINKDCVTLYEKTSSGSYSEIPSSLDMVTSDAHGNDTVTGITYFSGVADSNKKDQRKDVLYVDPASALKAGTTYKVVVDGDLCANNSATLGSNATVYFTTTAQSSGGSGGSGSSGSSAGTASTAQTVPAGEVGNIAVGAGTTTLSVNNTKAEDILQDSGQTALAIDLSDLRGQEDTQVDVKLPAAVLALARTESKPIILNYGNYVMVIPPGSLPTDKEITLEAKNTGTPSTGGSQPGNVNGLEQFVLSARDSSGNDVTFNDNLNMEFDVPADTVNPDRLCIYYVDDTTGEWIYSGGRIVNGKLVFSPEHYSTYVIAESTKTFSDISSSWAKNYIEAMVARQISKGVSDTLFAPDKSITRAEFAVLLARVLGLDSTDVSNTFSDVPASAWYQKEVSQVAALKIVTGDNGMFRPNDKISRQEMAVMLARAADYTGADLTTASTISYSDKSSIASWASAGVSQISGLSIMSGYPDGSFGGGKNSTRAEATKTLKVFMDKFEL